jgi:hypothetical protein
MDVGRVLVKGWDGPWGIGDFTPGEHFAQFAPPFGLWSLLMHAKTVDGCLSDAASDELRSVECEIDTLRAELLLDTGERRPILQLNIDGPLIEWKEDGSTSR